MRATPSSCWCLLTSAPMVKLYFLAFCFWFTILAEAGAQHRAVYLDSVSAITLHKGRYTSGRRLSPIPQLKCVKGCEPQYEPDVVQCRNVGSDGFNVQWQCHADLPEFLKFSSTEVVCEGYDSAEDSRVLEGSCGLEYSLRRVGPAPKTSWNKDGQVAGWNLGQWMMLGLILYIFYNVYRVYFRNPNPRPFNGGDDSGRGPRRNWWGGNGGGYGGYPGGGGGGGGGGYPGYGPKASTFGSMGANAPTGGGWNNAFTGLGLGYLLGQWTNRPRASPGFGGGIFGGGPSRSWFGSAYPGSARSYDRGESSHGGRSSSPVRTRQASAYAGTRRR